MKIWNPPLLKLWWTRYENVGWVLKTLGISLFAYFHNCTIAYSASADADPGPDLYMAGDSIMADYTPDWFPQYGWGQALKAFMKDPSRLHNLARSGWSARRSRAVLDRSRCSLC